MNLVNHKKYEFSDREDVLEVDYDNTLKSSLSKWKFTNGNKNFKKFFQNNLFFFLL